MPSGLCWIGWKEVPHDPWRSTIPCCQSPISRCRQVMLYPQAVLIKRRTAELLHPAIQTANFCSLDAGQHPSGWSRQTPVSAQHGPALRFPGGAVHAPLPWSIRGEQDRSGRGCRIHLLGVHCLGFQESATNCRFPWVMAEQETRSGHFRLPAAKICFSVGGTGRF